MHVTRFFTIYINFKRFKSHIHCNYGDSTIIIIDLLDTKKNISRVKFVFRHNYQKQMDQNNAMKKLTIKLLQVFPEI